MEAVAAPWSLPEDLITDSLALHDVYFGAPEPEESQREVVDRLYRPWVEPAGGLTYGSSGGVQIELWSWEDGNLILPIENSLTRRTLPAVGAVRGTVDRYGLEWPTIENMFADHATDIDFDIDMVFSWVDGNSPAYRAARAARWRASSSATWTMRKPAISRSTS